MINAGTFATSPHQFELALPIDAVERSTGLRHRCIEAFAVRDDRAATTKIAELPEQRLAFRAHGEIVDDRREERVRNLQPIAPREMSMTAGAPRSRCPGRSR